MESSGLARAQTCLGLTNVTFFSLSRCNYLPCCKARLRNYHEGPERSLLMANLNRILTATERIFRSFLPGFAVQAVSRVEDASEPRDGEAEA